MSTSKPNSPTQGLSKADLIAKYIRDIDDFIKLCNEDGCFLGMSKKESDYEISIEIPATKEDARDIKQVFEITYQGTYPFLEMYDLHWIMESFRDDRYIWKVFRMKTESSPDYGHIIGCYLWVVDYESRTAYNRGFNLLPHYHGKIAIADLTYSLYRKLMLDLRPHIDRWYNESRTAHSISQFLSHGGGAHTHALFLNKDYFLGKKESDAMMCAYFKNVIAEKREAPKTILPEIAPLYRRAKRVHRKEMEPEDIPLDSQKLQVDPIRVEAITDRISRKLTMDNHNYIHFSFVDEKTGSYIKGLHTVTVNNVEKITFHGTDPEVMTALFQTLDMYIRINRIEYAEWRIPASNTVLQRIVMDKMIPLGYVPCWTPSEHSEDKWEDVVVFGWMDRDVMADNLKLTPEGQTLLECIDLDAIHKRVIQGLPTYSRWDYNTLHVASAQLAE